MYPLKCVHCGAETQLIVSGFPVCVTCDEVPGKTTVYLVANLGLRTARTHWKAARAELTKADEIAQSLPKGHPDGTQALKNANASLKKAGEEVRTALRHYSHAAGKK